MSEFILCELMVTEYMTPPPAPTPALSHRGLFYFVLLFKLDLVFIYLKELQRIEIWQQRRLIMMRNA